MAHPTPGSAARLTTLRSTGGYTLGAPCRGLNNLDPLACARGWWNCGHWQPVVQWSARSGSGAKVRPELGVPASPGAACQCQRRVLTSTLRRGPFTARMQYCRGGLGAGGTPGGHGPLPLRQPATVQARTTFRQRPRTRGRIDRKRSRSDNAPSHLRGFATGRGPLSTWHRTVRPTLGGRSAIALLRFQHGTRTGDLLPPVRPSRVPSELRRAATPGRRMHGPGRDATASSHPPCTVRGTIQQRVRTGGPPTRVTP